MEALYLAKKKLSSSLPRLAFAYRQIKRELHERRGPKNTPFGFQFMGNAAMEAGAFEGEELELILKCSGNAEVLVNVGANVGYYCCIALHSGKELIAFEPDERNLRTLYKNLRINNWSRGFEIYPMAISNESGLIELFGENTVTSLIQGWDGAASITRRYAPCSTLDNVLGERLEGRKVFFLVDIEGAEFLLLQGAQKQLHLTPQATWMVEISVCEHLPKGVTANPLLVPTFETFWAANYEAFTADARMKPVCRQDVMAAASSRQNIFGTHNFLFVPKDR
jgi:FkbM family methyltransferase